jgi:hypothetical protein
MAGRECCESCEAVVRLYDGPCGERLCFDCASLAEDDNDALDPEPEDDDACPECGRGSTSDRYHGGCATCRENDQWSDVDDWIDDQQDRADNG